MLSDLRNTDRAVERGQLLAACKRIVADDRDAVRDRDAFQRRAGAEGVFRNLRQSLREPDRFQPRTGIEYTGTEFSHAVRNGAFGEIRPGKCTLSDTCDAVRNLEIKLERCSQKGTLTDPLQTCRNDGILRERTVGKGIVADARQSLGQIEMQDAAIRPRTFFLIIPHVSGAGDRQRIRVHVEIPCEIVAALLRLRIIGCRDCRCCRYRGNRQCCTRRKHAPAERQQHDRCGHQRMCSLHSFFLLLMS